MMVARKKSIFKEKMEKGLSSKLVSFYPKAVSTMLLHIISGLLRGCSEFQILYLIMGYFSQVQKQRGPFEASKVMTKKKKAE